MHTTQREEAGLGTNETVLVEAHLALCLGPNGELLLLSNEMTPSAPNLSFEREIGKLIAYQDTLALVMAQRTNRNIRRISQGLATAIFLPL